MTSKNFRRGLTQRGRLPRLITAVIGVGAAVGALAVALTASANAAPPAATAAQAPPAATAAQALPACTAGTLVHTKDGPVCGVTAGGVTSYLGIDYAAPPVGSLRWQSPRPATPWTSTFQATAAGNACPQNAILGTPSTNEDCLNLLVQVPAGTKSWQRLPVIVQIHGGGFLLGAATQDANLVTSGPVAYVAMNYRLGIFGFMAEKALGPHSGDYGLQDQQAALRWVKQNIARFGGNPRNVTIYGTSAGGASVCAQTVSPTARGLFQRGISRSGFYNSGVGPNQVWEPADCKSQLPTENQAQQAGAQFAKKLGCGNAPDVAACLRSVPAATLLAQAGQVLQPAAGGTTAPTINGTTLPMSPGKAFATGHINNVGLTIGVDRDEINGGVQVAGTSYPTTPAQYRTFMGEKYGALASTVERLYPINRFPAPSAFIAFRTAEADADSVCPALVADQHLARHGVTVYAYEVDDADPPGSSGDFPFGARHGAGDASSSTGLDANQAALATQVTAEWTGYARTGNPTAAGTPLWTRYTEAHPDVMSIVPAGDSALVPTSTLAAQHNCGFWDAVTHTPRK